MRLSGLQRLIYLLEGDVKGHRNRVTGVDMSRTFRTVEANTQAQVRSLCVCLLVCLLGAESCSSDVESAVAARTTSGSILRACILWLLIFWWRSHGQ